MKAKIYVPAIALMLSGTAMQANASTVKQNLKESVAAMTAEQKEARGEAMKTRIAEIKEINKSDLSRNDRREMRTELKDMNKEAKAMAGGGVYLTVGAILLIVLILILIL